MSERGNWINKSGTEVNEACIFRPGYGHDGAALFTVIKPAITINLALIRWRLQTLRAAPLLANYFLFNYFSAVCHPFNLLAYLFAHKLWPRCLEFCMFCVQLLFVFYAFHSCLLGDSNQRLNKEKKTVRINTYRTGLQFIYHWWKVEWLDIIDFTLCRTLTIDCRHSNTVLPTIY